MTIMMYFPHVSAANLYTDTVLAPKIVHYNFNPSNMLTFKTKGPPHLKEKKTGHQLGFQFKINIVTKKKPIVRICTI